MSFDTLGLSPKVLDAVKASGYETPTPIQEQAIPHVLQKRDVMGIAQTGTGKTASFVLPMLSLLEKGRARARMPRTLILEPTRELAAQVEENFNRYGKNHKLTVALLIGGVSFDEQLRKLDRGADVLIATPGRLLDHFERGKLLMTGVEILVIDEADRMLDMGFIPDIERIVKLVPFTRQTLFFSATMPPEIEKLSAQFLQNPVSVSVSQRSSASTTIIQRAVAAPAEDFDKRAVLRRLIDGADNLKNAIIFCNRKTEVATLWRSLDKHGYSCGALHGDMDQRSRMAMLQSFKDDKIDLLVASDVAARGLDIPEVSHVFNYDVPINAEDYVHRIGRTGRAGRSGESFTIATPHDRKQFEAIEALLQQEIEWLGDPVEWEERGSRGRGRRSDTKKSARSGSRTGEKRAERRRGASRDETPEKADKRETETGTAPEPVRDSSPEPAANGESGKAARNESRSASRNKSRPAERSRKPAPKDDEHPFGGEEFVPAFLRN
ncbi:MAG: DEAD/DEAH box helicase [Pseudomonadota bacterium]|nr:DEAD/DEAH box helicase [Pseudomonadota bacterium]